MMLNEQQLEDIKTLQEICDKEDTIQLKLNWEMLKARKDTSKLDFFHYEADSLIGFLAVYPFGNEYEICGMVHPNFRNRGVFTTLFNEAIAKIPDDAVKLLINAPAKSESAKKWLKKETCTYSFSEYQMKWQSTKLEVKDDLVKLRIAVPADLETKIKLDVACFGFDEVGAREFNQDNAKNDKKTSYMIEVNEEIIGKIGIMHDDKESYIYGFAIFPIFQGKGYGRIALTQTILAEQESGKDIVLEVATKNKHALKLYENCGFRSNEVQDYYQYNC